MDLPTECWELKKRGWFADVEVIAGIFYRRNHRRIQKRQLRTVTRSVHRWKMPTKSPRDSKLQLRTVMRPVHRWQMPMKSLRDSKWQLRPVTCPKIADGIPDGIVRRWIRRQKLIYPLSLDPTSPISPSSSPFSSSSQLSPTANNQPPSQKKSPSSQHNKSYILKSSCHSIRVLIYLWIFISFYK